MTEKHVSHMTKEELLQWLKRRQAEPLYVGSDEHEGMSLCYINPAIIHEAEETEPKVHDEPPAIVDKLPQEASKKEPLPEESVPSSPH